MIKKQNQIKKKNQRKKKIQKKVIPLSLVRQKTTRYNILIFKQEALLIDQKQQAWENEQMQKNNIILNNNWGAIMYMQN